MSLTETAPSAAGLPARLAARLGGAIPEIALLLVTSAVGLWARGRWLDPIGDPGLWWSLAERLSEGERLYKDIWLQIGPLSPYLVAWTGEPFGRSALWLLLVNWIPAVALAVLLLRVTRVSLSAFERLCLAVLLIAAGLFAPYRAHLVFPYSPAAVHALCFSTGALLLARRESRGPLRDLLAGILAGLALCAKQEIGVAAVMGLCLLLILRSGKAAPRILVALSGFFLVSGLGALYVFSQASFDSLRYDSHFWPIGTFPPEWLHLSRLAAGWTFDLPIRLARGLLGLGCWLALIALVSRVFSKGSAGRRPLLAISLGAVLVALWVWRRALLEEWDPLVLSTIVAFTVCAAALFDRRIEERALLAAFALFAGLVSLRGAFSGLVLWSSYSAIAQVCAMVTWCLFLFCLAPRFLAGPTAALLFRRVMVTILLIASARAAWLGAKELANPSATPFSTSKGTVWLPAATTDFFSVLERELRLSERVLLVPESNAVEPLFQVRSSGPSPWLVPGCLDERAEEILIRRFQTNPPDAVVVFRRPMAEFGVAPFGFGFGKKLRIWILQNYALRAQHPKGLVFRR